MAATERPWAEAFRTPEEGDRVRVTFTMPDGSRSSVVVAGPYTDPLVIDALGEGAYRRWRESPAGYAWGGR